MSYRVDGHNTVGNKTVLTLDALRSIPTQGAGDVYPGQMVMVSAIDYATMVGSSTGTDKSLLPDIETEGWSGPSEGYISLSSKQREYLHANFPVGQKSLVDDTATGTSVSLWFNAFDKPVSTGHQVLFHCPTLSADQAEIKNEFVPNLAVKGLSISLARHPGTRKPAIFYTLSATAKYTGSGVSGPLFLSYTGWVDDEIDIHEWNHIVFMLDSYNREVHVYLNGKQRLRKPLIHNIPNQADYGYMYINGENHVTSHDIYIGASEDFSDSRLTHHFNGNLDGFSYIKKLLHPSEIETIFNNGVINQNFSLSSNYDGLHWAMGDFVTDFTASSLIIENSWDSEGYPSIAGVNCTSILNLKSKSMAKQYNVIRMQKDYSNISEGYSWHRSFPISEDLISRRSVRFYSDSATDYSYLISGDIKYEDEWARIRNLSQGTLAISFFPDSSEMEEPEPGESSTYSILSIGHSTANAGEKNGLHVYLTKNSFLNDWTVVVVFVDSGTGIEIPFYGQGNLAMDSWNTAVFSWDLSVESGDIAASLYLNKMTLSTKYMGGDISTDASGLKLPTSGDVNLVIGVNRYISASGEASFLNPFGGRIDDIVLSDVGLPSDHQGNINLIKSSPVMESAVVHYTFGDSAEDRLENVDIAYWSKENRVQNVIDPGIEGNIKNDLFRLFVGQNSYSRLIFEDGFSGSSIPVPRDVPSNWGTYYWDAEHEGWDTVYPNDIDYGFILVRPNDVDEEAKGRWVSIVSYTAWTSYLFSQSDTLSLESGSVDSVSEGDVAVFTESGKILPQAAIEQWVNPNLFPNNKPAPDSPGYKGQRCYDGYYMYECVATNTWIRYLTEAFWSGE